MKHKGDLHYLENVFDTSSYMSTLGQDLLTALDTDTDSDVEFYFSQENKILKAHKIILAARSPTFRAMFLEGDTTGKVKKKAAKSEEAPASEEQTAKESQDGGGEEEDSQESTVQETKTENKEETEQGEAEEIEEEVRVKPGLNSISVSGSYAAWKKMLQFIYSDTVELSSDVAAEVLSLAQQYGLKQLERYYKILSFTADDDFSQHLSEHNGVYGYSTIYFHK